MVKQGYKQTEIGVIPEDWEVIPLSNVFSYISYGFTNPMPTTNSGPWMVTANDVKNGRINYETARKTSEYAFKKLITDKSRPKIGDLLLTKDGTLGRVAIVDKSNICINQSVAVIRTNDKIEVNFLKHLLQDNFYQKVMIENAGGSTIKHIYITVVDKMPIVLPPLPEQEAIAEALSDADAWIESLEQLIAKKRLIKQGAMQELLTPPSPSSGNADGEALEPWEVKKLGEMSIIYTGKKNNQDKIENGKYPFFVRSQTVERINSYSFNGEAILIPGEGNLGSIVHYINGKFDFHQRVYKISGFTGLHGRFLYFYFRMYFGTHAMQNTVKATVDSIRLPTLEEFIIKFPSLSEQTRIATILSDMDAELETLEQQLDKAQQIKQGMMQELLTGRVRLV